MKVNKIKSRFDLKVLLMKAILGGVDKADLSTVEVLCTGVLPTYVDNLNWAS